MRLFRYLIFSAAILFAEPGLAQKLVDPNSVAPEFREAAEKRRAEQVRQMECRQKIDGAKVLPRDRIANGLRSHKSYDSRLGHIDGCAFPRLSLQGLHFR